MFAEQVSFIHSRISMAPLLLRGAPESSMVKKNSFKTIIECKVLFCITNVMIDFLIKLLCFK